MRSTISEPANDAFDVQPIPATFYVPVTKSTSALVVKYHNEVFQIPLLLL